jgi:hypothetical protein
MIEVGGPGDMPIPLYVTFVVVGFAIGAALGALLVGALVSIVRQPALGPAGKVGWILLCLVLPHVAPASWFVWSRRAYGRTRRVSPNR